MKNRKIFFLLSVGLSFSLFDQLKADFGDPCHVYKPCNTSNILDPVRCENDNVESTCVCDFHMFRHEELNRCVSPHNMTCTVNATDGFPWRTCTEFSECVPHAIHESSYQRQNGTCFCDDDAKYDPVSLNCKLTHGSTRCKKETDCDFLSSLTCRENECLCQDEEFQIFDNEDGKCKSLVGGSCVADVANPTTVAPECYGANMKCDNETTNSTGKCICDEGYGTAPDDDKMCMGLYGSSCHNGSSLCNKDYFLECSEDVCKCQDKYEDDNGTCKGFVGQQCRVGEDEGCTGNLVCGATAANVCGCPDRHEPSGEMECVSLYSAPCSNTMACSESRLLSCNPSRNLCDCFDPLKLIYEEVRDACVAKANMECSGAVNGTKCVSNASCLATPPVPSCRCNQGYEANVEGRCVKVVGGGGEEGEGDNDDNSGVKTIVASSSIFGIVMMMIMAV